MPALSQAAAIFCASPHVGAMGFSQWIARTPARTPANTAGPCRCGHRQMLTMSGCSAFSIFA